MLISSKMLLSILVLLFSALIAHICDANHHPYGYRPIASPKSPIFMTEVLQHNFTYKLEIKSLEKCYELSKMFNSPHSKLKIITLCGNDPHFLQYSQYGQIDLAYNARDKSDSIMQKMGPLDGNINLSKIPKYVTHLSVAGNKLTGYVRLIELPSNLESLDLGDNKFDGPISLGENLPKNMKHLWLYKNNFHGIVHLTDLPKTMETLNMADTLLRGVFKRSLLPPKLQKEGLIISPYQSFRLDLDRMKKVNP